MCFWKVKLKSLLKLLNKLKENLLSIIFSFLKILPIVISVLIFFAISIFLFSKCYIQNPAEVQSQEIYFCNISLNNWGAWITLIGLFITAIWSIHQYKKNSAIRRQERASSIALAFSDKLIEKMGLISGTLMENKKITEMMKRLDTKKLNQFTKIEMKEIMGDEKCFDEFREVVFSKKTQKRYNKLSHSRYNNEELKRFESHFPILIQNTLNELEALCINISSQAAGSEFIYNSLHQMFLYTIEILSIKISGDNTNNVDKYYTNIISVYNMWNIQKNKDIKKLRKTNKRIKKLEQKKNKEVTKLLNKTARTI